MLYKLKKWFRPARITLDRTGEGGYYDIWRVAYPLIIMNASHTIMQVCDRKFLSYNSTLDVAAALPAGILSFVLFSFFLVTLGFTSTLVAQYFGRRDREDCVRAAWNGFYLGLAMALILTLIVPWIGLTVIQLSGHDPMVAMRERQYYLTLIPCGIFACMGQAFFSYFSGQGKTWYVAAIQTGSCVINVVLDYILIFGKCGLPPLGIVGAGLATSLSTMCATAVILILFTFQNQRVHPTRSYRTFDWSLIRRLLRYGSPSGARCFLDIGAFTVFTFLAGTISNEALAISTIICSINMLSFMPLMGIADATGILVGQHIGRGYPQMAEQICWRALRLTSIYVLIVMTIYLFFPVWLVNCFAPATSDSVDFATVLRLGSVLLMYLTVFNVADSCRLVFLGALSGAGDTRAIMLISVVGRWMIMVPGLLIMLKFGHLSLMNLWQFWIVCRIIEAAAIYWRFRCGAWKQIKMIHHKQEAVVEEEIETEAAV